MNIQHLTFSHFLTFVKKHISDSHVLIVCTYAVHRSVGLPQSLINEVEGERPTSPVFTEAQQFVLGDVQTYFKSFFKVKYVNVTY